MKQFLFSVKGREQYKLAKILLHSLLWNISDHCIILQLHAGQVSQNVDVQYSQKETPGLNLVITNLQI